MSRASWLGNFAQWGSFCAAIIAVGISAGTAYFSIFRQSDDVSVVLDGMPQVEVVDNNTLGVTGAGSLVFTNTGTRPIAVLEVGYEVIQKKADQINLCRVGNTGNRPFRTDVERFVIKPNDVLIKKFEPLFDEEPEVTRKNGRILFPTLKQLMIEEYGMIVQICMFFRFSTLSEASLVKHVDVGDYSIDMRQRYMSVNRYIDSKKPWVLVREKQPLWDW